MKSDQVKTKEFADSLGARVTFPSEPRRPLSIYEKTDVQATWDRFRPELDFDDSEGHRLAREAAYSKAPDWWRSL